MNNEAERNRQKSKGLFRSREENPALLKSPIVTAIYALEPLTARCSK